MEKRERKKSPLNPSSRIVVGRKKEVERGKVEEEERKSNVLQFQEKKDQQHVSPLHFRSQLSAQHVRRRQLDHSSGICERFPSWPCRVSWLLISRLFGDPVLSTISMYANMTTDEREEEEKGRVEVRT